MSENELPIIKLIKEEGLQIKEPETNKKDFKKHLFTFFNAETNFLIVAKKFIKKYPFFYDKNKIWWIWNKERCCYEIVDEIDICNAVDSLTALPNTNPTIKNELIEALRRVGRLNIPKEPKKTWVQFKDTIVDAKTGETFKAVPEYFICNPIPWSVGETEDTPTMDKFFRDWVIKEGVQDESYVKTLYEILAYAGLQHQFMQRLFALTGSGSNGKGTFFKLIEKFYGEENICSTELKLLSSNIFESSALYKKLICEVGEVDSYDLKNTNLLKKLTGEDLMRYGFKGKTSFTAKSGTTIFVATNALPITPDKSMGYYRRWLIVDFPYIFEVGRDIISEIPEIEFNNLAKKCVRILKELYEKKQFTNEGNTEQRTIRYEERSNPIMKFVENECTEDPEEYIILQEFYKRFNDYLKEKRLRLMTTRMISYALRNEGFIVKGKHIILNKKEVFTTCVWGLKIQKILKDTHFTNSSLYRERLENSVSSDIFDISKPKEYTEEFINEGEEDEQV